MEVNNSDAILNAVENGEDPSAIGQDQQSAPQEQQSFRKEFIVNGKPVEVTDQAKYDQWAQQGYHYSQQMEDLNNQRAKFEQQQAEMQARLDQYKSIDAYARENPDWWNHVEENWNNREIHKMTPELQAAIKPFMSEFNQVKEFINNYQKQQEEIKAQQEDAQLQKEVEDLGKQFPEVNFGAKDQSGQSLEMRILQHANAHGIPSFRAAFLDYYHQDLLKVYEGRGRKAVETDLANRKKSGILGQSKAPVKAASQSQRLADPRRKSWSDVLAEGKQMLGLA